MTLRKKLTLICGVAANALTSAPAPFGLMRAANAQEEADWTCNGFVPVTLFITPPWPRMRVG